MWTEPGKLVIIKSEKENIPIRGVVNATENLRKI